jgi:hypothetical protein
MFAVLRPMPAMVRLWQGGIAVAIVVTTLAVANFVISPQRAVQSTMLGHDFLAFYTAGTFAREDRPQDLYDLDAVRAFEHQTARANQLELDDASFGPYWNPPFYAWLFAPLSAVPYRAGLGIWVSINAVSLLGAIALLCRLLPLDARDWKHLALVPLLLCTSMPCIMALSHGQSTCMSLLILCATVSLWRARRAFLAGLCAGLLCYKPQLAAILSVAIVFTLGWRSIIGLMLSAAGLLALGEWSMPGSTVAYLQQLPLNVRFMQDEHAYLWERHVTLKAFWRLLLQGRGAGEAAVVTTILTAASAIVIAAGLALAWYRSRCALPDNPWTDVTLADRRDRFISAIIVATPLLMPFYFDFDLLLLAVPAVLYAAEQIRANSATRLAQQPVSLAWIALFFWLYINPGMSAMTHFNATAAILMALSGQYIVRACRGASMSITAESDFITSSAAPALRPLVRKAA